MKLPMVTSHRLAVVALMALLLLAGCSLISPRPEEGTSSEGDCEAPITRWMEVRVGYDRKELAELAGKLQVAAQADASKLQQVQSKGGGEFASTWKATLDSVTKGTKVALVSQDFFTKATAYRQAVCNLERQIKNKILTSPAALEQAQSVLVNLSRDFGAIKDQETKRFQQTGSMSQFNVFDGQSQHVIGTLRSSEPGVYDLEDDLYVGHCIMRKGSAIRFDDAGLASYSLWVRTTQTTKRDIWHQSWILGDGGTQYGEFDSPHLFQNQPFRQWAGTFQYAGAKPSSPIVWRSRC